MKAKPSETERSNARKDASTAPIVKKKRSTPKKPKRPECDGWGHVMRGYERVLSLGPFADAGKSPRMTDVEVAVCFADLRGFTDYVHCLQRDGQDNKVQHFLRDYFQVYPQAVLHSVWSIEPDKVNEDLSEKDAELKRLIVPASYKNLGDGMMIVWELQTASSMVIQGLATRYIFGVVEQMQKMFTDMTSQFGPVETDSYSTHAAKLKLGFGLARGHAWRLDFGHQLPIDYAGSIVNLAARLQSLGRPHGIVAQLGFSESMFKNKAKEKNGNIYTIDSPKGLGSESLDVWASSTVVLPKRKES